MCIVLVIYIVLNAFLNIFFSLGGKGARWTRDLDLGVKRRVFYRCANVVGLP